MTNRLAAGVRVIRGRGGRAPARPGSTLVLWVAFALLAAAMSRSVLAEPGQDAGASALSFEVASLKINDSGPGPFRIMPTPGRLRGLNVPAKFLLAAAFAPPGAGPLYDYQIIGGPHWLETARFDFDAKAPGNEMGTPLFAMLRTLVIERLKMVVRHEQRERPIYRLVVARRDGRIGPQLRKRSDAECKALAEKIRNGGPRTDADGRPLVGANGGADWMTARCGSIASLISSISRSPYAGGLVVDGTGLQGAYDYDVKWTPSELSANAAVPTSDAPVAGSNGTVFYTALQEQLGLRLESTTGLIDVIVIEKAELPVEN